MFKFTLIAVTLFLTTAINFIAAVISWLRIKTKYGLYFAMGMAAVTFWTLISGLDYAAVPIPLKVFFAKCEYIFYNAALVFFLIFILSYAGYEGLLRKKPIQVLLWIVPVSNILLAWTNDWHGWLWSDFIRSEFGDNTLIFKHGPGFLWVAFSGYMLVAGIVLTSWLTSRRGSVYSRRQGRLLFFASLLPLVGNLIYQFQPSEFNGVDWSSILFSASSLLFVWVLYGTRLLDLVPIARERLIDSLRDGMVVIDTQGRIVDFNSLATRMIGARPDEMVGSDLKKYVPFPTNSLLEQQTEQGLRTELEVGGTEKRYFDVLVSPLFEDNNVLVGYLVTLHDITRRRQNELHLLQLNQAVEQSPTSIVITDLSGNMIYVNPHFTTLTGYSVDEVVGQNQRILKSGHTPTEVYQDMWQTIISGETWKGEFLNKKKNGDLYWEQATISPVLDDSGKILNFVAIKEDITERKHAQEELKRLARTDSLTGLSNRRYFFEIAEKEFAESIRYDRPISVIIFDLDRFKEINDTYGHLVGDQALIHIGQLLRNAIRTPDTAARYGGEEFVVLLPETESANAMIFAERLRKLVADSPIQNGDGTIYLTISLGVAGKQDKNEETFDQLISKADQALYQAKEEGRNRVVCYGEDAENPSS